MDRLEQKRDEIETIGPLLEVLYGRDLPNRGVAATALVRLLPRLKTDHSGLLHPRQRACLLRALDHPDIYLVRAALKALQQIGGEHDLRHVEHLARTTTDPDIQAAADACLPALRERAALSHSRRTLLRPATSAEPAPVLLRAARDTGESGPDQLLRAAPSEPPNEP